jgi:hypothetical protein
MGLFNSKPKTQTDNNKTKEEQTIKVFPKPKICCIDIEEGVLDSLAKSGFSLYNGYLGGVVNVPNKRSNEYHHLLLDNDFPENFHEYDILILDLTNEIKKDFSLVTIGERKTKSKKLFSLICSYPTTIFDPRPLSASFLGQKIREVKNRKFIQIVFASEQYEVEYEVLEIDDDYPKRHPNEKHQLYDFNHLPISNSRIGSEVTVLKVRDDLQNLLRKHLDGLTYEQTFYHPTVWSSKDSKNIPSEDFVPFMTNVNDEIISFVQFDSSFITFVFPNFKRKNDFLSDFLKNILPSIYPDAFPYSTQFKWVESPDYHLPNHRELQLELENLKAEYEKRKIEIENRIGENSKKFNFLHSLITETGDKLVSSVFSFLKWLEFKNVVIKDEHSISLKEEDIQVQLDNGILVIEVKGIGGTSTDSECSQVSKIKHRREKERKAFDVYALYIVNHQRYLPPTNRTNPPFNEQQIADAISDERGLLSTWQLFNLYKEINEGLISKEEARLQILQFGHVIFRPKLKTNLGQPKELLKGGYIVILDITDTEINVNDTIVIEKGGAYTKAKILSLQLDNKEVPSANNCEVGIKLDTKVYKNSTLWTQ